METSRVMSLVSRHFLFLAKVQFALDQSSIRAHRSFLIVFHRGLLQNGSHAEADIASPPNISIHVCLINHLLFMRRFDYVNNYHWPLICLIGFCTASNTVFCLGKTLALTRAFLFCKTGIKSCIRSFVDRQGYLSCKSKCTFIGVRNEFQLVLSCVELITKFSIFLILKTDSFSWMSSNYVTISLKVQLIFSYFFLRKRC